MKIVFENDFFVIIDKPSGVLSVPGRFGEKDPRPVAGLLLQEQLKIQIFPVHRLDFEVSGLLLFAKTKAAHAAANSWFENKKIKKVYSALTEQILVPEKPSAISLTLGARFEWKSCILRGKKRAYESPHGKPSLTLAEFLGEESFSPSNLKNVLRWRLEPVTGRSHQLRFDLARHGFPILGDALYGSTIELEADKIALSAVEIHFPNEATSKWSLPLKLIL
jgi:tRNA pseudouridine32 synthase/23S rRNA pseudouridine746 synthase